MATDPDRLGAYLGRIGVPPGDADLTRVHRAHVTAIPFENLDPQRGVPVSLEPESLFAKLVDARRGGYCFEHNHLLGWALAELGYGVEPMLGRVRVGRPPGELSSRSHMALRVSGGDGVWLADVGFGNGTLLEPIPFGPGDVHEQSGWRYRVVADGPEHVLQTEASSGWVDLYGFLPEPVPPIDLETSNWFTATHPRSPFVRGLMVSAQLPDGRRVSLTDWSGELVLRELAPGAETATGVARDQVPELLAARFGLPGFAVGPDGRIRPAD